MAFEIHSCVYIPKSKLTFSLKIVLVDPNCIQGKKTDKLFSTWTIQYLECLLTIPLQQNEFQLNEQMATCGYRCVSVLITRISVVRLGFIESIERTTENDHFCIISVLLGWNYGK